MKVGFTVHDTAIILGVIEKMKMKEPELQKFECIIVWLVDNPYSNYLHQPVKGLKKNNRSTFLNSDRRQLN